MTTEKIDQHINFLKNEILHPIIGQTRIQRMGKNKNIRESAGRLLDDAVRYAGRYLEINKDLFDFMVEHHGCDPAYLEYPEWNHIEGDTREYIEALIVKRSEDLD